MQSIKRTRINFVEIKKYIFNKQTKKEAVWPCWDFNFTID